MGMDIRLARIDDRLIHGQVATAWSKMTGINRIIVVSDEVANDQLRKFLWKKLLHQESNQWVTVAKCLRWRITHYLIRKSHVIIYQPQDVVTLVKEALTFVPSISAAWAFQWKTMITNFVSVNDQDLASLLYLQNQGIEVEIRKVPADRKLLKDILERGSHP